MKILPEITADLPEANVESISVGNHWTAVVVEQNGVRNCGLASNPIKSFEMNDPLKSKLSELEKQSAHELCEQIYADSSPFTSIGLAAINALLPHLKERWVDRNAGDEIARYGKEKSVALVGHFPFVPDLKQKVGNLDVLELRPRDGDLFASEAPRIIPNADVVAITSMAFVNGTMEGLLDLCSSESYVIVLGPSTPLSPVLFDHGIDLVCGSIVEKIDPVVESILAGKSFRQIKPYGVRLVTIESNHRV